MANLAARIWRGQNIAVAIVVENAVAPTDAEWETFAHIAGMNIAIPNSHSLALTDGGGPNATQRARINAVLATARGKKVCSAVVTGSLRVRGLVGALRLFHRDTEAFSPTQIRDALHFIGLAEPQWESLWATVMEANAEISPRCAVVERAARFLNGKG